MTKHRTTHRRRQAYHRPFDVTGAAALLCIGAAAVLAMLIVYRADQKTLAVSVALCGSFLSTGAGLLAQTRSHGRSTDPQADANAGSTVETTTTVTPPPAEEGEA